ncbi:hypothetical protein GCM10009779_30270 [Polymorphospora rubra]|uniref:Uncharacterized protein n=1 Tax=Polymorphospora rubra TaxID=338584 RepID=A0A810NBH0_9ACTN|nr:hypothetical protein Prubr_64600 [Polymorphospora rubra]
MRGSWPSSSRSGCHRRYTRTHDHSRAAEPFRLGHDRLCIPHGGGIVDAVLDEVWRRAQQQAVGVEMSKAFVESTARMVRGDPGNP